MCAVAGFDGQIFLIEMVVTYIFVAVILTNNYNWGSTELYINAMANGLTLFGMLVLAADVSGGCMNPAVGIAQLIFQQKMAESYPNSFEGKKLSLEPMWLYIMGPMCGGILAGLWKHYNTQVILEQIEAAKLEELEGKAEELKLHQFEHKS